MIAGNNDITFCTPKEVIDDNLKKDLQLQANNNRNNHATGSSSLVDDTESVSSIDPDEISLATTSSASSRPHSRAWGPDRLLGIRKEQSKHIPNYCQSLLRQVVPSFALQHVNLCQSVSTIFCLSPGHLSVNEWPSIMEKLAIRCR